MCAKNSIMTIDSADKPIVRKVHKDRTECQRDPPRLMRTKHFSTYKLLSFSTRSFYCPPNTILTEIIFEPRNI